MGSHPIRSSHGRRRETSALICGRLYDAIGFSVLITISAVIPLFAPLVFLDSVTLA